MRYSFILILFILISCNTESPKPNFLFLFSDDHTTQAISAYGDGRIETPHLDKLAAEGLLFENCFCTNAICAPSRATVLTGKYNHLNGIIDNVTSFDGSQQTFPKLLQDAGYRTAMIGKWHLKSDPTGFDYWTVLPGQGKYFNPEFKEMGELIKKSGYVTEIITDEAVQYLKTYNYDKPFCLMVQHKAPHADWEWPDELKNEFQKDFRIPDNFNEVKTGRGALDYSQLKVGDYQWKLHYRYRFGEYPYDSDEKMYQRYMHDYMRCIRAVDNSIGKLMEALEKSGYEENTIVIYSSDQGFFLGEHGLYDKRFMYDEAIRMPLIVRAGKQEGKKAGRRGKGISLKGLRLDGIVLNLDFGPTILDLAGLEVPADMQGRSFAPLLYGEEIHDWRQSMYYHFYEQAYNIGEHEGIRTHQHKLIHFYYPEEAWELYDLEKDPDEMNNLIDNPDMVGKIDSLMHEMDSLKVQYLL